MAGFIDFAGRHQMLCRLGLVEYQGQPIPVTYGPEGSAQHAVLFGTRSLRDELWGCVAFAGCDGDVYHGWVPMENVNLPQLVEDSEMEARDDI